MTARQITTATRRVVAERSGGVCEVCSRQRATEMSHRNPRSMGGTTDRAQHLPAGLIHCCHGCHQGPGGIERDRSEALRRGWLLWNGQDPEETPVWLHTRYGPGWWLLDNDGCYRFAH